MTDTIQRPEPEFYLHERYAEAGGRSALLEAYYAVKRVLPRKLQLALRRAYSRRQAARDFPAWPAEDVLVERDRDELLTRARAAGGEAPFVWFWPGGRSCAIAVTHDVEGPAGIARIPDVLALEARHGIVSSWNLCAEWYGIPEGTFDLIRDAGGEIGLHGVRHDGRLFRSRESFEAELPKIHRYMREWGAVGFRSPALHRNADWMAELGCEYDSSFPDTDPFEPQSGGCCSVFPFFFGDVVELPVTLVQDHTLWAILRRDDIGLWRQKTEWIAAHHGLVNVIVHPDYLDSPRRMDAYEELLSMLRSQSGAWHALPRDIAAWWRRRHELDVGMQPDGSARVVGPAAHDAVVGWARDVGGRLALEPTPGSAA